MSEERTTEKKREESFKIPQYYGFQMNFHQKSSDTETKLAPLEKMFKNGSPFSYTWKRVFVSLGLSAVTLGATITYLTRDPIRYRYLGLPMSVLCIAILILIFQYLFVDNSSGSLLQVSLRFLKERFIEVLELTGKKKRFREMGFDSVDKFGTIHFVNGDVGVILEVDGYTSKTSYPSEIIKQSAICEDYQNGRNTTTTEIKITSSETQNIETQKQNLRDRILKYRKQNPELQAIADICEMDYTQLTLYDESNTPTIVQHIIVRDPSERVLSDYLRRMKGYVSGASGETKLYKQIRQLNKKEAEAFLTELLSLK